MADGKKIELKFRTEGESKAYMEGYSSAVDKFCWWLKNYPVDEAINSMMLVADTLTHTFVMKDNTKERPHGKWIFKHNSADIWCSNCDENFDEIPQKFLFCPNCGADMRKEGDPKCGE